MKIEIVDTVEGFALLESRWQTLATLDEESTIFNGWAWNWLWWQHYGQLGKLHILTVCKAGELVAIAPFYRVQTRLLKSVSVQTIRFLGSGGDTSPDDLNILAMPAERNDALIELCDHLLRPSFPQRLQLNDIPETSTLWRCLERELGKHKGYLRNPVYHIRRHARLPTTWDVYREQISRNTHKQIKRRRNRLQRMGQAVFKRCCKDSEVEQARLALIKLHHARWDYKGGSGAFRSAAYRDFHRDLMYSLHRRNELWLMTLSLDDEIIGVEYGFCVNKTLAFFQTGFDPAYEQLSPGHLLMTYAIEEAIATGVQNIDLLKGDYSYKTSYANDIHTTISVDYFKPGFQVLIARFVDYIKLIFGRNRTT